MLTTALAVDFVANLATAAVYAAVARIVTRRQVDSSAIPARRAFAFWWTALAGLSVYGAAADVLTMLGGWTLPLMVAAIHVLLLVILMALAGLFYYLVFLYTGREGAWKPIVVAYGAFWAYLVYYIEALRPDGLQPGALTPTLHYVHDPEGTLTALLLGLLLLLPILAAAVAYFTLYFKTREATQRYRIAVVSLSIVLWFGFSLAGTLTGAGQNGQNLAWLVLSRAVSLGATLCIYAAYRPPTWVQRRWGVTPAGA